MNKYRNLECRDNMYFFLFNQSNNKLLFEIDVQRVMIYLKNKIFSRFLFCFINLKNVQFNFHFLFILHKIERNI